MIQVTDLQGVQHSINPGSISQIYPTIQGPPGTTTIAFGGAIQMVRETAQAILVAVSHSVPFVALSIPNTGPGMPGFPIWINADAINGVKPAPAGTAVLVAGLRAWETVAEDYRTVMAAIAQAKGAPSLPGAPLALAPVDDGAGPEMAKASVRTGAAKTRKRTSKA